MSVSHESISFSLVVLIFETVFLSVTELAVLELAL